ncbi:ras guanine nucleotide exchange factor P [Drosophila biarmipes]|uniref:ras guanine nucleotide exchange factor P n=1 Tax=Drosophila biarmipes TaxID=125945 RepID=UPI0007E5F40F|nr:ras guanine nucleotide exchange factor P [Drosophila biarmipes]
MTLPTNTHASANDAGSGHNNNHTNSSHNNNSNNNNGSSSSSSSDEDSDMFGPPRCSPPIGYHHHRSRVPMISPKLRQREERKRILQLCAHKLERIKDSEANLRRSVCINNTYCRLTDELRREKQMRYLQNLPRTSDSGSTAELARENLFQPNMDDAKPASNSTSNMNNANGGKSSSSFGDAFGASNGSSSGRGGGICSLENQPPERQQLVTPAGASAPEAANSAPLSVSGSASERVNNRKRHLSSSNLVNDLEILDRELSAINAPMLLIDPEITQGAEQLEKAALSASRKRLRSNSSSEDESDRLVREALSQFYIPPQRLISAIEECPLDVVGLGMGMNVNVGGIGGIGGIGGLGGAAGAGVEVSGGKRMKLNDHHHLNHHHHLHHHLELVDFDMNQNQKDFEVIMDALRLGTPTPPSGASSDSCGQAAMMSESASVFHNLVVTSLET